RPGIERAGTLGLGAVVGITDVLGLYCQVEGRSAGLSNLFPPGFRKTVAGSPVCDPRLGAGDQNLGLELADGDPSRSLCRAFYRHACRIVGHSLRRLSDAFGRRVLRLGKPRLGREIAGADRSAVSVAKPLLDCPRWFDIGSLAAGATYACRI